MKVYTLLALIMTMGLTGCLEQDIQQTLYLQADGSATWHLHILETENHQEGKPQRSPQKVYDDFISNIESFEKIMSELGGTHIDTVVLRAAEPFEYVVRGDFEDIGPIFDAVFEDWPQLAWRYQQEEDGLRLIFEAEGDTQPEELLPMLLVPVNGQVTTSTQKPSRSLRLETAEQWRHLQIRWK